MRTDYKAPWWMPGGHMQTIWPAVISKKYVTEVPHYQRHRLSTPDGDFVDVDHLFRYDAELDFPRPLLILFHGLEGSSQSHYARAFAQYAQNQGWNFAVPHFRGCSGELNSGPRAYHSGDYQEIYWLIRQLAKDQTMPVYVVGVSLGGNALLRWAQEMGSAAASHVSAIAAVSAPLDLAACGNHIDQGLNRTLYVRNFLRTMKPRAVQKHMQFPGLFDLKAVQKAKTLYEFDQAFTAPLHGFKSTEDYWRRASSVHHMKRIRVPTLVLNAKNDPFVPAWSLPVEKNVSEHVCLMQPSTGGHVGFAAGSIPGNLDTLPEIVGSWFLETSAETAKHG